MKRIYSKKRKVATDTRERNSWATDDTPLEIWRQILSYLSVKSLLRFRSVSKVWKSLIEEPYFASLHLQRCPNNVLEPLLLVKEPDLYTEKYKWVIRCSENFQERPIQVKFPIDKSEWEGEGKRRGKRKGPGIWAREWKWECVTARDGLLLLQKSPGLWGPGDVKLWNPSISKSVDIDPPSPTRLPSWYDYVRDSHFEAFLGFDPSSNDYKVVSFVTQTRWRDPYAIRPSFYVYSLKDRLWEEVSCNSAADKYLCGRRYMTYSGRTNSYYDHKVSVGEYIHWIEIEVFGGDSLVPKEQPCLVSLNLTTLTISFAPLSDQVWRMRCPFMIGSSFLGLLAEGFDESCAKWSKMKDLLDSGYYHIRKDGLILVLTNSLALFVYDLKTDRVKKLFNRPVVDPCYINAYMESLVLVDR